MESSHPASRDSLIGRGGRIPGASGRAAFELSRGEPPIPVVIAVPHAGRCYPEDLTRRMRHPAEAALRLEDRMVDRVARELARETGAALIVAQAPRAMIDLNRAPEDMDWGMIADPDRLAGGGARRPASGVLGRRARGGLGLVPRRLPGLGELWRTRMSAADLEARIACIHQPYHRALGEMLEGLRGRWGGALLIDLHSMPPLGPKDGADPAPDFVLGDRFGASCGAGLSAAAIDHLAAAGCRATHNRPYAGGYVLDRHAAPARGIHALQVELCRAAYLDDELREIGPGLARMVRVLAGLVRQLAEEVSGNPLLAEAAE
jgi:N-formylglutamate amidohydrolase